jgi:hypothetical protein
MESTTIRSASRPRSLARDDRVLLGTRMVAGFVILILALAVWVLYLHPDETDQAFAWTIKPRMTALALGAGYAMGAYFFARVLTSTRWHRAALGFMPITAFTIAMLLATLLHWDRFHHGTFSFALWVVIYAITPLLVPLTWLRNRSTDPGTTEPHDLFVPRWVRRAAGLAGLAVTLFAVLVFVLPDLAIRSWPWQLTPLTARVFAGWMLLPGIGGLVLSRERRWSGGWRLLVESVSVGALLFFIGVPRAWTDWQFANPLNAIVLAALVFSLVAMLSLYVGIEIVRRRSPASRMTETEHVKPH